MKESKENIFSVIEQRDDAEHFDALLLKEAIQEKQVDKVRDLLQREGDGDLFTSTHKGNELINLAIQKQSLEILKLLLNKGFFYHTLDADNKFPLDYALESLTQAELHPATTPTAIEIVNELLNWGAAFIYSPEKLKTLPDTITGPRDINQLLDYVQTLPVSTMNNAAHPQRCALFILLKSRFDNHAINTNVYLHKLSQHLTETMPHALTIRCLDAFADALYPHLHIAHELIKIYSHQTEQTKQTNEQSDVLITKLCQKIPNPDRRKILRLAKDIKDLLRNKELCFAILPYLQLIFFKSTQRLRVLLESSLAIQEQLAQSANSITLGTSWWDRRDNNARGTSRRGILITAIIFLLTVAGIIIAAVMGSTLPSPFNGLLIVGVSFSGVITGIIAEVLDHRHMGYSWKFANRLIPEHQQALLAIRDCAEQLLFQGVEIQRLKQQLQNLSSTRIHEVQASVLALTQTLQETLTQNEISDKKLTRTFFTALTSAYPNPSTLSAPSWITSNSIFEVKTAEGKEVKRRETKDPITISDNPKPYEEDPYAKDDLNAPLLPPSH